jgi:hypothetical protein
MGRSRFNKNFPHRGGPVNTVSSLTALTLPASTQVSGHTPGSTTLWDFGTTFTDSGTGTTQVTDVADPNGSGVQVVQTRVKAAYPDLSGTNAKRAEFAVYGPGDATSVPLTPAHDYWIAFAVMRKSGETFTSAATANDDHLIFQTHTPAGGDAQPDISVNMAHTANGHIDNWRIKVSYQTAVVVNGSAAPEASTEIYAEAAPAAGQWMKVIIHYRPGYTSAHNPLVDVWVSKNHEAYRNVRTWTGFNTYNYTQASYPRIGIYKWTTFYNDPITYYQTKLFCQEGANLYNEAVAALAAL